LTISDERLGYEDFKIGLDAKQDGVEVRTDLERKRF
jgi:hypothetical protein